MYQLFQSTNNNATDYNLTIHSSYTAINNWPSSEENKCILQIQIMITRLDNRQKEMTADSQQKYFFFSFHTKIWNLRKVKFPKIFQRFIPQWMMKLNFNSKIILKRHLRFRVHLYLSRTSKCTYCMSVELWGSWYPGSGDCRTDWGVPG